MVGVLFGAPEWGFMGALTLGFVGWLVGMILKSNQRAQARAAQPAAQAMD